MKSGEITRRLLASPHSLAVSDLLQQALMFLGHSGNRWRTQRLPSVVPNGEVEERIRCGETEFRDERAVEK